MSGIEAGAQFEDSVTVEERHSAHAYGNYGVHVTATPALIGMIEVACAKYIHLHIGEGKTTVGTKVNVEHLAAAPIGVDVSVSVRVLETDGRRVGFEAEARWGDTLLMRGSHQRAIVDLERFMASLPQAAK